MPIGLQPLDLTAQRTVRNAMSGFAWPASFPGEGCIGMPGHAIDVYTRTGPSPMGTASFSPADPDLSGKIWSKAIRRVSTIRSASPCDQEPAGYPVQGCDYTIQRNCRPA